MRLRLKEVVVEEKEKKKRKRKKVEEKKRNLDWERLACLLTYLVCIMLRERASKQVSKLARSLALAG